MKSTIKKSIHLVLIALTALTFSNLAFAGGSESGDKDLFLLAGGSESGDRGLFVLVGGLESGDKGLFVPQSYRPAHHELGTPYSSDLVVKVSYRLSGGSPERAKYIQALYSRTTTQKLLKQLGALMYPDYTNVSNEYVVVASLYASMLVDKGHADDIDTAILMSAQMYYDQIFRDDSI
jgi:hypothetical protein